MGTVEDVIAAELLRLAEEANTGEWAVNPSLTSTSIWVALKKSKTTASIMILEYFRPKGVIHIHYEVEHPQEIGEEDHLMGYAVQFNTEITLADPKSLQKVEATLKDYVERGNMGIGA